MLGKTDGSVLKTSGQLLLFQFLAPMWQHLMCSSGFQKHCMQVIYKHTCRQTPIKINTCFKLKSKVNTIVKLTRSNTNQWRSLIILTQRTDLTLWPSPLDLPGIYPAPVFSSVWQCLLGDILIWQQQDQCQINHEMSVKFPAAASIYKRAGQAEGPPEREQATYFVTTSL